MRIGIDLGGTKIEGIVMDRTGEECHRVRVPTPTDDYDAILEAVAGAVQQLQWAVDEPCVVGMATPGAISPTTGLLRNSNTTCLNGRPLLQDMKAALGRPIRTANDANCFALSEAVDGAGADSHVVFGVIVGTGTGGGITVGRQVLTGPNAVAGEWGHNPLPWPHENEHPGPACYCGKRGCIETFLSGPGLAADHLRETGMHASARDIAEQADAGDADARATMERYADRMARALASVIDILDPDVIVLGGGLSNMRWLYRAVPRRWHRHVFSDTVTTELRAARHGDASGVRGAAWLWPADHR